MALAKTLLKPSEIIESKLYLKAILTHFDIKNLALQLGYSRATVHYWINNERNLSLESLENMRALCQRTLSEKELENIAIRRQDHRRFIPKTVIKRLSEITQTSY